ncbi:hypothetical protein EON80_12205 [bacterium]|nr:MAG: hypothetical protein EON80_12205 [bacterium]
MKRLALSLALLCSTTHLAWAQEVELPARNNARPAQPEQQIEFDLKGFLNVLNSLGPESNATNQEIGPYLSGARIGYFGASEWTREFAKSRDTSRLRLEKFEIEKLEGDLAVVNVTTKVVHKNGPRRTDDTDQTEPQKEVGYELTDKLTLKLEAVPWDKGKQLWRIVPVTFKEANHTSSFSLTNIAYFAAQRPGTSAQIRASIAMQRLKQACLGALQFVQDYDLVFLFQNDFYVDALSPYVKSETVFTIPGTRNRFTFNDNLSEKMINNIPAPAETVLFYEGENQKPVFRYDGKAVIAFADGHVGLLDPDQADEVRWKP